MNHTKHILFCHATGIDLLDANLPRLCPPVTQPQARFAALSEYYKKVKRPAPITKQQTNQPKNINSHAELSDPNLIKSKDALNDPKLTPRLLEVDEKSVLDAQQQSRSLLRENSNHKTRQGKLRRRHIRGSQ